MHTRLVNLCTGGKRIAGIFRAAVEDQSSGRVEVSIDPSQLKLTVNGAVTALPAQGTTLTGEQITLRTGDVEIELKRGLLLLNATSLLVIPLPE